MLSQRHSAAAPVTDTERTMKRYSSGMVALEGSKAPWPARKRIKEPYFSNISKETSKPGMARRTRMTATPRSSSPASASAAPRKVRFKKSPTRQPNGDRQKALRRSSSHCLVRAIMKRSEEHTSELQSLTNLVCRLLLEKKKKKKK